MVDGISFKTSDTIAFNMGLPKNSIMRIRSGIIHILRSAAYTSGHVYMPKDVLIEHTVYTLKVTDDEIIAAVPNCFLQKNCSKIKLTELTHTIFTAIMSLNITLRADLLQCRKTRKNSQ